MSRELLPDTLRGMQARHHHGPNDGGAPEPIRAPSLLRSEMPGGGAISAGAARGYGGERSDFKKSSEIKGVFAPQTRPSLLSKELREAIAEIEIFGGREWRPVVSSGGVACGVSTWRPGVQP